MQLNGIDIDGYSKVGGGMVTFMVLAGRDGLGALHGTDQFKVTDEGRDYEDYGGFGVFSERFVTPERTEVTLIKSLTPELSTLLNSIYANLSIAGVNIDNLTATANAANDTADRATQSAATANSLAEANAAAIEEIAATVFAE